MLLALGAKAAGSILGADSLGSPRILLKVLSVRQSADMPAYRRHSLDTVRFADLGPVLASGRVHLFVIAKTND